MYFLFGVVLINTIRKEFFRVSHNKILNVNSDKIFIPEKRDNYQQYIPILQKNPIKPKYIFILPGIDILLNKNKLWRHLSNKYYHNLNYLYHFLPKSFTLENHLDKKLLEALIYKKNQNFPIKVILSNSQGKFKIFQIKNHLDFFDLQSEYREGKYNLIQQISPNYFKYQEFMLVIECYLLVIKNEGKIQFLIYDFWKIQMLNLLSGKLVEGINTDELMKLLENNHISSQKKKIDAQVLEKVKFLKNNCESYILENNQLDDSKLFDIVSCKMFIDDFYQLTIFDISQNINLISKESVPIFTKMVFETYSLVRGETPIKNTNFKLVDS